MIVPWLPWWQHAFVTIIMKMPHSFSFVVDGMISPYAIVPHETTAQYNEPTYRLHTPHLSKMSASMRSGAV